MKPLVVGLGNELLSDDSIGVLAARKLDRELSGQADVIESNISGVALLDVLVGRRKVIIIDSIRTATHPPGTIIELDPDDLRSLPNPSPHYTGLPEVLSIAEELRLDFPEAIKILAVEVADSHTVGGSLSEPVAAALSEIVGRAKVCLRAWEKETVGA